MGSRLIDSVKLGRLIRGTRISKGYQSVEELVDEIERRTGGYRVSPGVFYKVERGEMLPKVDLWLAVTLVLFRDDAIDPILWAARGPDFPGDVHGEFLISLED